MTATFFPTTVKFLERDEVLKYYFKQLRKTKIPTDEEERYLFIRYKNGDEKARDKIILGHQRFVFSIAKIYAKDNSELIDYVNEGNIGLIEAIDKYDIACGTKFLTFATWYVRRAMNYYIISKRDCVVKSNAMKLFKKIDRISQDFFVKNERYPSDDEIKEILTTKYNIKIINSSDLFDVEVKMMNDEYDDGDTFENSDEFINAAAKYNDDGTDEKEYRKSLAMSVLKILPKKQQEFIKKLYGIGYDREYTVEELAKEYYIEEDEVPKISNNILSYLRENYNTERFKKAVI